MRHGHWAIGIAVLMCGFWTGPARAAEPLETYEQLLQAFQQPDHARYGEVPLWWWEGEPLTKQRVTWELETLAAQGVRSVCPIQRSPARCDPPSFTPQWWEMFEFVHSECQRLGMTLWAYDQIGYGHYGWLEKAAAKTQDDRTMRVVFLQADADPNSPVKLELPEGECLGARAYPLIDGIADDQQSVDLSASLDEHMLRWTPASGSWRVAVSIAVSETIFQLSDRATDTFLDMLYGEVERRLGRDAMGQSFVGMFQDEHPSTPRDVYTERLAELFQQRCGYDIARAIPALHFDVGSLTPKYRTDYFDSYLMEDERCYWRRVFDWTQSRGLLTSHDNWGRQNLVQQSFGYIDYFRTQRWFSAPGNDDAGQAPLTQRNYYDTKIAASIARLYQRPRVWSEAFHSSGWGRTTEQTLSWLSADYAFGANLYDEHGLYYSARASTWEHAAPDPHWRQPYWRYYGVLSDWVARMSFVMCQGTHVTDVAVHYPVAGLLAGEQPGTRAPDYNHYMRLSRKIYDAGIDNDIIDDDSILRAEIADGKLTVANNSYQALVFGPQATVRRAVLEQALALAQSGGCVIFCGQLPSVSTESGRDDPQLAELLTRLLGERPAGDAPATPHKHRFSHGGRALWISADDDEQLATIVDRTIVRDFQPIEPTPVFVSHRRIGETDVYLVQNTSEQAIDLEARFRVQGTPQLWNAFTGEASDVDGFEPAGSHTLVQQRLEGNVAQLIVFRPEPETNRRLPNRLLQPDALVRTLDADWTFSVIPTRDNRRGEFRWPPSEQLIGPEVRSFRYALETPATAEQAADWHAPDLDDSQWSSTKYSIGPYWLYLTGVNPDAATEMLLQADDDAFEPGRQVTWENNVYTWQPVEFSQTIGLARPAPWGGHSGYPDGAIDQNFVDLPEGRKTLFTRLVSPHDQRRGLSIELRQSAARLWVNGVEQPIEGAVGNLPLRRGNNTVLLELADGGHGMLYVQTEPPSRSTLAEVGQGDREPPFAESNWIQVPGAASGYFRKSFQLSELPREARVVVTGYTGYRLFVNGTQVEEDIGPWAKWTDPETINIAPYLRAGPNVIAAWVQVLFDQNVRGEVSDQALALAMRVELPDGQSTTLVTDETWRGSERDVPDWQTLSFDDSDWAAVKVLGSMGIEPYGSAPLKNVGAVTEPRRRLAIDLRSPNITCFEEVPEVIYDVFSPKTQPVGWYRFEAPPGLRQLNLGTQAASRVWVDGKEVPVREGIAEVSTPPTNVSHVAVRMMLPRGAYAGAALPQPIAMELAGGTIQPGLWADFALPTYAGIGVYQQSLQLSEDEAARPTELDLGNVLVAAELFVNGQSAGVRLARPFRFDLSDYIHAGDNLLEIHVANTLAPHYLETNESTNLGPTDSGLLGPVTLRQQLPKEPWLTWADQEVDRLQSLVATSSEEVLAAQREWELQYGWTPLVPQQLISEAGNTMRVSPDQSVLVEGEQSDSDVYELEFVTHLTDITGVRVEALPDGSLPVGGPGRGAEGRFVVQEFALTASLLDGALLHGRTVRVQILDKSEFLHMAEVQVFCGDVNLAPVGTARQSSTTGEAAADRAIDGNIDGSWPGNSVSHTNFEPEPWWEVDLGSMQSVHRIVIWNRTDGQLEMRLDRFRVSLLDDQGQVVWQQIVNDPPDPTCKLYLSLQPVALVKVSDDIRPAGSGDTGGQTEQASDAVWSGPQKAGQRDSAVFETRPTCGYSAGTRLALRLEQSNGALGQFRVSVTTMPTPLLDVPPEIADILAIERDKRSSEQAEKLSAFFRSISPQLEPIRRRLFRLQSDMALPLSTHAEKPRIHAENPSELGFDDALAKMNTIFEAQPGHQAVERWPLFHTGSVRLVGWLQKLSLETDAVLDVLVDGRTIWSIKLDATDALRHGVDVVAYDLSAKSTIDVRVVSGTTPVRVSVALQVMPEPFVSRWTPELPSGYPTWSEGEKEILRKKGQGILQTIAEASKAKVGKVVIPPGDYLFHARWSQASTLRDLHDLEIVAQGVTFWFEPPMIHALQFDNCRNVTVRGLTIDFTIPCWFQAHVTEVDYRAKIIRATVMKGYEPCNANGEPETEGNRALMFYDAQGRFINHRHSPGTWELVDNAGSVLCGKIERSGIPAMLKAGDYVVGTIRTGAALRSNACEGMRFEDVQIWSSPGMAVWEGGGAGGNVYLRVRATRRPYTNRLQAFGADVFHLAGTDCGPTLDRCESAYGADDNLNIHGSFGRVVEKVADRRYYLEGAYDIGDAIEFWDQNSVDLLGVAKVVSVQATPKGPSLAINEKYSATSEFLVELDRPLELPPLALVVLDGKRSAAGFVLRNCWLHDNFQRTLINGSPNGLIENNTLQNVGHGLTIQFETWGPWMEGPFARNLVIRNNRFLDSPPDGAAIDVSMHPAGGGSNQRRFQARPVTNVTIIGNCFGRTSAAPLNMHNVSGLKIHGNSIDYAADAPLPKGPDNASEVNWLYLQDCSAVSLQHNLTPTGK